MAEVEGGRGRGRQRQRAAEYDAESSLYPHCILTVSLKREAEGGGWRRRRWKAEGGGRWLREDGAESSLYPRCILTVSLQREVSAEAKKGEEEEEK